MGAAELAEQVSDLSGIVLANASLAICGTLFGDTRFDGGGAIYRSDNVLNGLGCGQACHVTHLKIV